MLLKLVLMLGLFGLQCQSCNPEPPKPDSCQSKKSCSSCLVTSKCFWDHNGKTCADKHWYTVKWSSRAFDKWDCACSKCKVWYDKEKKDTKWLAELNTEIPCPCKRDQSNEDWKLDLACAGWYLPLSWLYHPGAYGCIRSKRTTASGAGQQCCYYANGNLIPAGTKAAGTPDKATDSNHGKWDVEPYGQCCKDCENQPSHCNYYINDVRKGDYSHCGI